MENLNHLTWCRLILPVCFLFCFLSGAFAQQKDVVPGKLRIKVSEQLASQLSKSRMSRTSGVINSGIQSLDKIHKKYSVHEFKRVFRYAGIHEARHRKYGLHLWYEVEMSPGSTIEDVLAEYNKVEQIEHVEPVYRKSRVGSENKNFGPLRVENIKPSSALSGFPNDPMFSEQWHYHNTGQSNGTPGADIDLLDAWKMEKGKRDVIVAVMDGGIQYDHPDLAANMWINPGEIAGNNIDDDHNGYVDDIYGYGFGDNTGTITPDAHGTHVAGTIAAVTNNGIGVSGVAGGSGNNDGVRLMSCAVFGATANDNFAEAYVYAADMGAVISQNSWGYSYGYEQVVRDAIRYFYNEAGKDANGNQSGPMKGGLLLFSSGNYDWEGLSYPAAFEEVMGVSATNHNDKKTYYSNFGLYVDISAPGGEAYPIQQQGVLSTLNESTYGFFEGTSMACPHVSGAAALVVSKFGGPGFDAQDLFLNLIYGADDINPINPEYKKKLGLGRVNAKRSLHQNDNSAPQAIHDLQITLVSQTSLSLQCTVPADAGDLPVSVYDLRYSTEPINTANFNQALIAANVPTGGAAGSEVHFSITGLQPNTLYYIALKSGDAFNNISPISNVVSMATLPPSAVTITPLVFHENLATAERIVRNLKLFNPGEGKLEINIEANDHILVTPNTATVAAGDSLTLSVVIHADNLLTGVYTETLRINTNAPSGSIEIPVHLTVLSNGHPIVSVLPDSLIFENVPLHVAHNKRILIRNKGSQNLVITSVSSDNHVVTPDFYETTLIPFDTLSVPVQFKPETPGLEFGIISILTNDPVTPHVQLPVKGYAYDAFGGLVVAPESLTEELFQGETSQQKLMAYNRGTSPITIHTSIKSDASIQPAVIPSYTRLKMVNTAKAASQGKVSSHGHPAKSIHENNDQLQFMPAPKESMRASTLSSVQPLATTYQYAANFESFIPGPLDGQQGWYTYYTDVDVSQVNPAHGQKHARFKSQTWGAAIWSPQVAPGTESLSSMSVWINLSMAQTGNATWWITPGSITSGYVVTVLQINDLGNISALIKNENGEVSLEEIPFTLPNGYVKISITVERQSKVFHLYIHDELVYSGEGFAGDIEQVQFSNAEMSATSYLDIDDFRILDGGHEGIPYAQVTPSTTTLAPGDSLELTVDFDASNLPFGNFESELEVQAAGAKPKKIRLSLNVTGASAMNVTPQSISANLTYDEGFSTGIQIKNTGGTILNYTIEPADTTWLSVSSLMGYLQPGYQAVVMVNLNSSSLPPGIHTSSITIHANGTTFVVPVNLNLAPPGRIQLLTESMYFESIYYGQTNSDEFIIENTGDGILKLDFIKDTKISTPLPWQPHPITTQSVHEGLDETEAIPNNALFHPYNGASLYDEYFGDFSWVGKLNGQDCWAADDSWDAVSPFAYQLNIRGYSNGSGIPTYSFSPRLVSGAENISNCSFSFNTLYSKGSTWQIIPQSMTNGKIVTRLQINPDQTFQVLVKNENGDPVFQRIDTKMPEGYYSIEIKVDRHTSYFTVFIDGFRVYTGKGFSDQMDQVAFMSRAEQEGSVVFINGSGMYINSGESRLILEEEYIVKELQPGETMAYSPRVSVKDMPIGIYYDTLRIRSNNPDQREVLLPYVVNVTESFVPSELRGILEFSKDTIQAVVHEGETAVHTLSLSNAGDGDAYFDIATDISYGYKSHVIAFEWEDISAKGFNLGEYLEDDSWLVMPMDFKFPFFDYKGISEEIAISSNGYLGVNLQDVPNFAGDDPANRCIANYEDDKLRNVIAPYWEDHVQDELSGIYTWGDSLHFIVQYDNVLLYGTDLRNTFQVILHPDGRVIFKYLKMNDRQSATVAIGGNTYSYSPTISCNEPFVRDSLALQIELPMPWMRFLPSAGNVAPGETESVLVKLGFSDEVFEYPWWDMPTVGNHTSSVLLQHNQWEMTAEAIPVSLTVLENPGPVFEPIEAIIVSEGGVVEFTVRATDNDSIVTITYDYLPEFVTMVHTGNGAATFRVAPKTGDAQQYNYYAYITAADKYGRKAHIFPSIQVVKFMVQDFSLVYMSSGASIKTVQDTLILDVADPDIQKYTIRANTNPAKIGSVRFILDGENVNTRNHTPYITNGWVLPVLSKGYHTLRAEPFEQTNAKGAAGPAATLIIQMINSSAVTSFEVARNNGPKLMDLQEGSIVDISQPGYNNINVIANVDNNLVRSVRFTLNNITARIDNVSPYGVYGNSSGSVELPWTISPGNYTLTATPYVNYYGWGISGTQLTVNFTITRGSIPTAMVREASVSTVEDLTSDTPHWSVFPVPFYDNVDIRLTGNIEGKIVMTIRNMQGQMVYTITGDQETFRSYSMSTVDAGMVSGIYFIQLQYASGKMDIIKIMKE